MMWRNGLWGAAKTDCGATKQPRLPHCGRRGCWLLRSLLGRRLGRERQPEGAPLSPSAAPVGCFPFYYRAFSARWAGASDDVVVGLEARCGFLLWGGRLGLRRLGHLRGHLFFMSSSVITLTRRLLLSESTSLTMLPICCFSSSMNCPASYFLCSMSRSFFSQMPVSSQLLSSSSFIVSISSTPVGVAMRFFVRALCSAS